MNVCTLYVYFNSKEGEGEGVLQSMNLKNKNQVKSMCSMVYSKVVFVTSANKQKSVYRVVLSI